MSHVIRVVSRAYNQEVVEEALRSNLEAEGPKRGRMIRIFFFFKQKKCETQNQTENVTQNSPSVIPLFEKKEKKTNNALR